MKNSAKVSVLIPFVCLIIFAVIRFIEVNPLPLLGGAVLLSIIGSILGFRSKNALLTSINFLILLFTLLAIFFLLMLHGRALNG